MSEKSPGSAPVQKPASDRAIAVANEKRQHPRFKIEGATAVLGKEGMLAGLGMGNRLRKLVNLSQGGAMIQTIKRLVVGSRHPVRIEIPKYKEVIEAEGEVKWCLESAKAKNDFYVGISFADLAESDRKKIARMQDLFTSADYRAQNAVREASSGNLRPAGGSRK